MAPSPIRHYISCNDEYYLLISVSYDTSKYLYLTAMLLSAENAIPKMRSPINHAIFFKHCISLDPAQASAHSIYIVWWKSQNNAHQSSVTRAHHFSIVNPHGYSELEARNVAGHIQLALYSHCFYNPLHRIYVHIHEMLHFQRFNDLNASISLCSALIIICHLFGFHFCLRDNRLCTNSFSWRHSLHRDQSPAT